jgi:hypothetical protein
MRVNYLAGTPIMIGEDINAMSKPTVNQLMRDDRYMGEPDYIGKGGFNKFKDKIKKVVNNEIKLVKTVALAPARGPFLLLLDVNFRGLAKRLNKLRVKNPAALEEFWLKVGGKIDSLNKAIDKGKDKKAFLGEKKGIAGATDAVYIGGPYSICRVDGDDEAIGFDPATITTALAAAGALVAAVSKLMKKNDIGQDKEDGPEIDTSGIPPIIPDGQDFAANDPASPEAEKYALTGEKPPVTSKGSSTNFKPSLPLIIGGAAVAAGAIYILTKKKKK